MSFASSFLRGLRWGWGPYRQSHRNRFAPRLEALDTRDVPATFQVTTLADAGVGSLRQAILDANANPGADVIDFAVTGAIGLTSGQLAISDSVAINGPGADLLTVERATGSTSTFGIFAVGSAATVQIAGLTIAGGSSDNGGAINNAGTLTVSNCSLSTNYASSYGGAIYNVGTLAVKDSSLASNRSSFGGAIFNWQSGSLTIRNSTLTGNSIYSGVGGAVYIHDGVATISNSTLFNNTATGGSYYYEDPDSPYWPNGGEWIGLDTNGGGVHVSGGTVTIEHSTIAGNHAIGGYGDNWPGAGIGGGVFNAGGPGALRIYNSILADNTADYINDLYCLQGSFTSLGHNLIEAYIASGFAASDLLNVNPELGPLQDNGGPTHTMALLPGSPAINAGDNTGAPAYDQRGAGFPRILGGAIDIGAFELQTPSLPAVAITDVSLPEGNVGTTTALFTVRLSSASTETVTVNYSTADGSATVSDGDYLSASGTLTFAPGETNKTIAVLVNGDRRGESNETFVVNLTGATNAVIADGQGVGTIVDDEPTVFIYTEPVWQREGNSGTTAVTFTVRLTTAYDAPVTVNFSTSGESATAGNDFQAASGALTFAPGEITKTITVLVNGDRVPEPTESFLVTLSGATNAALGSSQSRGFIADDEPQISIGNVTMQEGKKGKTTLFTFTVSLSVAYDQTVTMSFRTADGTAKTSNSDYMAKSGTITFAPGETTKTITIEVKGDRKKEGNEYFLLILSDNSSNSWFTKDRAEGWILNDD